MIKLKTMKKTILFVAFAATYSLFGQKNTNHDLSCYSNALNPIGEIEEGIFSGLSGGISVTLDEELEIGEAVYEDMKDKYTLRTSGSDYDKV
jgi:hypothetical protein